MHQQHRDAVTLAELEITQASASNLDVARLYPFGLSFLPGRRLGDLKTGDKRVDLGFRHLVGSHDGEQRDMARAAQQREQADRQAEAARRAAGLASQTSGLTVALKAMQDAASKDLASADAQMSKARLLRPTRPEQDDPNIAAALAVAAGKPPAPRSLSERLAALKAS